MRIFILLFLVVFHPSAALAQTTTDTAFRDRVYTSELNVYLDGQLVSQPSFTGVSGAVFTSSPDRGRLRLLFSVDDKVEGRSFDSFTSRLVQQGDMRVVTVDLFAVDADETTTWQPVREGYAAIKVGEILSVRGQIDPSIRLQTPDGQYAKTFRVDVTLQHNKKYDRKSLEAAIQEIGVSSCNNDLPNPEKSIWGQRINASKSLRPSSAAAAFGEFCEFPPCDGPSLKCCSNGCASCCVTNGPATCCDHCPYPTLLCCSIPGPGGGGQQ